MQCENTFIYYNQPSKQNIQTWPRDLFSWQTRHNMLDRFVFILHAFLKFCPLTQKFSYRLLFSIWFSDFTHQELSESPLTVENRNFHFFSMFAVFKRILHIEPVHRSTVKIKIVKSIQYLWRINDHFTISIFFGASFSRKSCMTKIRHLVGSYSDFRSL